jgi:hypothetical protein
MYSDLLRRALRSGDTGGVSDEALEAAARLYDEAAEEFDQAARHCRTAARHFRDGEIPRAAAHAWAAFGHARTADAALEEQARKHARASNP